MLVWSVADEVTDPIYESHPRTYIQIKQKKTDYPDEEYSVLYIVRFVRVTGLEPAHRKTPDPKSGASTNFATRAYFNYESECKGNNIMANKQTFSRFFNTTDKIPEKLHHSAYIRDFPLPIREKPFVFL